MACCLITGCAGAQPLVKVNLRTCRNLTDSQNGWLGPEWAPYKAFTKSCEVKQGKTTALYLISVWADDYYAKQPASAEAVKFPKPILAAPDGKPLGRLPMDFPVDPPRTLSVTFARWVSGFPHEVRLWVDDPTVVGDHSLPSLEWDPAAKTYQKSKSQEKATNAHTTR
jgi:hypothetical protein